MITSLDSEKLTAGTSALGHANGCFLLRDLLERRAIHQTQTISESNSDTTSLFRTIESCSKRPSSPQSREKAEKCFIDEFADRTDINALRRAKEILHVARPGFGAGLGGYFQRTMLPALNHRVPRLAKIDKILDKWDIKVPSYAPQHVCTAAATMGLLCRDTLPNMEAAIAMAEALSESDVDAFYAFHQSHTNSLLKQVASIVTTIARDSCKTERETRSRPHAYTNNLTIIAEAMAEKFWTQATAAQKERRLDALAERIDAQQANEMAAHVQASHTRNWIQSVGRAQYALDTADCYRYIRPELDRIAAVNNLELTYS